jgi:hypothetical protein
MLLHVIEAARPVDFARDAFTDGERVTDDMRNLAVLAIDDVETARAQRPVSNG